jgi:hypothetical protein
MPISQNLRKLTRVAAAKKYFSGIKKCGQLSGDRTGRLEYENPETPERI